MLDVVFRTASPSKTTTPDERVSAWPLVFDNLYVSATIPVNKGQHYETNWYYRRPRSRINN
jgi:hypothetical protein